MSKAAEFVGSRPRPQGRGGSILASVATQLAPGLSLEIIACRLRTLVRTGIRCLDREQQVRLGVSAEVLSVVKPRTVRPSSLFLVTLFLLSVLHFQLLRWTGRLALHRHVDARSLAASSEAPSH